MRDGKTDRAENREDLILDPFVTLVIAVSDKNPHADPLVLESFSERGHPGRSGLEWCDGVGGRELLADGGRCGQDGRAPKNRFMTGEFFDCIVTAWQKT